MKSLIKICIFMFSAMMLTGPLFSADWVYIKTEKTPLKKGDVVLVSNPSGDISPMMDEMGWYFTHTLMVIDNDGNMRENTADVSSIKNAVIYDDKRFSLRTKHWPEIKLGSKSFKLPLKFDSALLSNLTPGIRNYTKTDDGITTSTQEEGRYRVEIDEVTGEELVKGAFVKLTTNDEANRPMLESIADEMIKMEGFYILHSFVNMEMYQPTFDNNDREYNVNGGHCSGTVWWANKRAGVDMNVPIISDPETIRECADAMYEKILGLLNAEFERQIKEKADTAKLEKVIDDGGIIDEYLNDYGKGYYKKQVREYLKKNNIAEKMANQVVNTFLFNRSYDQTEYWKNHCHQVTIASVAPDHLLMAGIPNPLGNFTGVQTPNSSYYNAIEDYTTNDGYYVLLNGDVPDDPRLIGTPPKLAVTVEDATNTTIENDSVYLKNFETIPMPEEYGGKMTKDIYIRLTNQSFDSPLELTGSPAIALSGDEAFSIISEPSTTIIDGQASTKFGIRFTSLPDNPGDYKSTVITLLTNDPDNQKFRFRVTIKEINNTHFAEYPIYYNQCDDDDDFFHPLLGDQFVPNMITAKEGGYTSFGFIPHKFGNGYRVGHNGKNKHDNATAVISPFAVTFDSSQNPHIVSDVFKPDLTRGTCSFWASANALWRKKGDDTFIKGIVKFQLTADTYAALYAHEEGNYCYVQLQVQGTMIYNKLMIPKKSISQFVVQWNLEEGFGDGTNIRLYWNGKVMAGAPSSITTATLNAYPQHFLLKTWTSNGGDYRPNGSFAAIDNIIMWNSIVVPSDVLAIK